MQLAVRLETALGPVRLATLRAVAELAAARRVAAFVVGGAVRDLLLRRAVGDLDVVVEADAVAFGRALVRAYGGQLVAHDQFGTAKWYLRGSSFDAPGAPVHFDLITARRELYPRPAALPAVTAGTLHDDLSRRDFTINTLALRLERGHFGELIDECGGLADLRRRQIRTLHPRSFSDDPTRMLRAVRYEQRYGFLIERRTLAQLKEARSLIGRLSHKRTRHELDLILDEPRAPAMMERLHKLGLLRAISAKLPWDAATKRRLSAALRRRAPAGWEFESLGTVPLGRALGYAVWLGPASASAVAVIQARLQLPRLLLQSIQATRELLRDLPGLEAGAAPSLWAERLDRVPRLAIYAAWLSVPRQRGLPLQSYVLRWRKVRPHADGHSLRKLGLPPSPVYQSILRTLRAAWLDGRVTSPAEEQALLESLLDKP